VDRQYAPCACSPLGRLWRVSQPYAPGGTVYWTTYSYDSLGRVTQIQHPDNSGVTSYVYEGNTVKVIDPAGRWKKYTLDAFGNLIQVTEPNPSGGADHQTYYAYNLRNQLVQVQMPRDGYTQVRTFSYDALGRLVSETHPQADVSPSALVARNRIITGLTAVLIVVETTAEGGAMHAARRALEQGRTVLTVDPAHLTGQTSGNQALIDAGARAVPPDGGDLAALLPLL
jgi:YD repeat-containing protein